MRPAVMATMNFSIPDDVKEAFNKAFEGENKSAVVARLMRRRRRGERERKSGLKDWSSGCGKSGRIAAP